MEKNADSAHTAPHRPASSPISAPQPSAPFLQYLKNELYRSELLSPLIKRVLWMLLPYGIGFILLNFFTTLLAVGLVIYVHRRHV